MIIGSPLPTHNSHIINKRINMQLYQYPDRKDWKKILQRPSIDATVLEQKVKVILGYVKAEGDVAVKRYTKQFDGVGLSNLRVFENEIDEAEKLLPDNLKNAIRQAAVNIRLFHEKQQSPIEIIETMTVLAQECGY
jgi:histidinol dehydrogenase